MSFVLNENKGILRAKGYFWLATRMEDAGLWSQAGHSGATEWAGTWFAAEDPATFEPNEAEEAKRVWEEPYGDRRQELVIIGVKLDKPKLTQQLEACLLTDTEMSAGADAWKLFPDLFPDWKGAEDDSALEGA